MMELENENKVSQRRGGHLQETELQEYHNQTMYRSEVTGV
jgi:hypothetical protein